jgi:disulfide oxidoreductase YuzD
MAKEKDDIKWLDAPEEHRYEAALSYLSLVFSDLTARSHVANLKRAPISKFMAKDIFRASGLSLLGVSNSHVQKFAEKIEEGVPLAPLLLVRDSSQGKVIVADGYHRLCAVYRFDEDSIVPCKIV